MSEIQKFTRPLEAASFFNGLVFFAPVSLLVRTQAGLSLKQFFVLQAICSLVTLVSELPAGHFTDCFGYRATFLTDQLLLCAARWGLFAAFLSRRFWVFVIEAVVEGAALSFCSGTQSAYLYTVLPRESYSAQAARISNWGTVGFFVSTLAYAGLYAAFGLEGLLLATGISHLCGVLAVLALPRDPVSPAVPTATPKAALCRKDTLLLIALLSAAGLAQLLINFFYAERLIACGLSELWMTPIILGYSAMALLSEPLLAKTEPAQSRTLFAGAFALCGAGLPALGLSSHTGTTLVLMLVLPLLLTVSNCLLGLFENELIDEAGQQQNRTVLLNLLNLSVSAASVFFLLGSSVLSAAGSTLCFAALGLVMIAGGTVFGMWSKRRAHVK